MFFHEKEGGEYEKLIGSTSGKHRSLFSCTPKRFFKTWKAFFKDGVQPYLHAESHVSHPEVPEDVPRGNRKTGASGE